MFMLPRGWILLSLVTSTSEFSLILWNISTPPEWIGSHPASWLWPSDRSSGSDGLLWSLVHVFMLPSGYIEPSCATYLQTVGGFVAPLWCIRSLTLDFERRRPPNWDTANGMRLMLTVSWPAKEKVGLFLRAPGGWEPDQTEQFTVTNTKTKSLWDFLTGFWIITENTQVSDP